jgi:hypothetical protein
MIPGNLRKEKDPNFQAIVTPTKGKRKPRRDIGEKEGNPMILWEEPKVALEDGGDQPFSGGHGTSDTILWTTLVHVFSALATTFFFALGAPVLLTDVLKKSTKN